MENSYLRTFVDSNQDADSNGNNAYKRTNSNNYSVLPIKENKIREQEFAEFFAYRKGGADPNQRGIIPIAFGTSLAVAGIFIVLAAAQILPSGINAISSWGIYGYVAAALVIGSGIIIVVVGLVLYFRHKLENEEKAYAHALETSFFYYDCDDVKDYGWGCAWRCIQICASAVNLFPKFKELYDKYSLDSNSQNEWAEPGYGKKYLDDEGIPNQLILYNKETGTPKTPTEWCEKINGFPALRNKLVAHFNQYATPIMADDVTFAMTIVGIRVTASDETILFIADPHKINRESGLYYVVLDNEGNQIATTGVDNGKNGLSTVKSAHFNKGWMLLFPQPERACFQSCFPSQRFVRSTSKLTNRNGLSQKEFAKHK